MASKAAVGTLSNRDSSTASMMPNALEQRLKSVLAAMSVEDIVSLKAVWAQYNSKVTEAEFVKIMHPYTYQRADGTLDDRPLCELFRCIDVDSTGKVDWEEFNRYILESGVLFTLEAYDDLTVEFYQLHNVLQFRNQRNVEGLDRFPHLNQIGVRDPHQPYRLMAPLPSMPATISRDLEGHSGQVLAATYVNEGKLLVTACGDCRLYLWDTQTWSFICKPTVCPHMSLLWCETYHSLYSGSLTGEIFQWSFDTSVTLAQMQLEKKQVLKGHTDAVTSIIEIPGLDVIVSASLDHKIIVWNPEIGIQRHTMIGHRQGVYRLAYSENHHLLASCGVEHDVYIWAVANGNLVYKIKGHQSSLVSVEMLADTPILLTADSEGTFRAWDLRNFQCLAVYNQESAKNDLQDFITWPKGPGQCDVICASSRLLSFFSVNFSTLTSYGTATHIKLTAVHYAPRQGLFYAAAGRHIFVYQSDTGKLARRFNNALTEKEKGEITAICMSPTNRKLYIGDDKGRIMELNCTTGGRIDQLEGHKQHISELFATEVRSAGLKSVRILISTSWDRTVRVYHERETDHRMRLDDQWTGHAGDILCLAHSETYSFIATGSADKTVRIYDLHNQTRIGILSGRIANEVTAVEFLDPFPLLVLSDIEGYIYVYTHFSPLHRFTCLRRLHTHRMFSVLSFGFDARRYMLFATDENGFMNVYSLRGALTSGKIHPMKRQDPRYLKFIEDHDFNAPEKGTGAAPPSTPVGSPLTPAPKKKMTLKRKMLLDRFRRGVTNMATFLDISKYDVLERARWRLAEDDMGLLWGKWAEGYSSGVVIAMKENGQCCIYDMDSCLQAIEQFDIEHTRDPCLLVDDNEIEEADDEKRIATSGFHPELLGMLGDPATWRFTRDVYIGRMGDTDAEAAAL